MIKLKVSKKEIQNALKKVVPVTKGKSTLPVLAFVKIEAKDNKINITGTNLEVRIETSCNAEVEKEGIFSFQAARLEQAVNKTRNDVIEIESNENVNIFKAGKSVFESPSLSLDDFPVNVFKDGENSFKCDSQLFIDSIDKISYAIADITESRKVLQGVYINVVNNTAELVATDAKRMSKSICDVVSDKEFNFIFKGAYLPFIKYFTSEIQISSNDSQVLISDGITKVYSKQIEGKYPEYNNLVPNYEVEPISINRDMFLNCVDTVLIAFDSQKGSKFTIDNDVFKIECINTHSEKAQDEFNIKSTLHETFSINPQYVKDILSSINDKFINIYVQKNETGHIPIKIECMNMISILMPMRDKAK